MVLSLDDDSMGAAQTHGCGQRSLKGGNCERAGKGVAEAELMVLGSGGSGKQRLTPIGETRCKGVGGGPAWVLVGKPEGYRSMVKAGKQGLTSWVEPA